MKEIKLLEKDENDNCFYTRNTEWKSSLWKLVDKAEIYLDLKGTDWMALAKCKQEILKYLESNPGSKLGELLSLIEFLQQHGELHGAPVVHVVSQDDFDEIADK